VQGNYSGPDRVSNFITGKMLLTLFISEVPGLKVAANRKKRKSKSVDHSSIQPPAHERIKAQLERRMQHKRQALIQEPANSKKAQKTPRGTQSTRVGSPHVNGGDDEMQQTKEGPSQKERLGDAATKRAHQRRQEDAALEKEHQRHEQKGNDASVDKAMKEGDTDEDADEDWEKEMLQLIREELDNLKRKKQSDGVNGTEQREERIFQRREEGENDDDRQSLSQRQVHQHREERERDDERRSISQREVHQKRLEALSQEKRSQTRPPPLPVPEDSDSLTESESEVEDPVQKSEGKEQVSP